MATGASSPPAAAWACVRGGTGGPGCTASGDPGGREGSASASIEIAPVCPVGRERAPRSVRASLTVKRKPAPLLAAASLPGPSRLYPVAGREGLLEPQLAYKRLAQLVFISTPFR